MPQINLDKYMEDLEEAQASKIQKVDASEFHKEAPVIEGEYTVSNAVMRVRTREEDPIQHRTEPYRLPIGPLRTLDPFKIDSRAELLRQLTDTLPVNEFNLPTFIYRPDFLDHNRFATILKDLVHPAQATNTAANKPHTTPTSTVPARSAVAELQNALSASTFELDYKEGYPTHRGFPLWERLPWESPQEYQAFQQYITIDGVRQISRLTAYEHNDLQQWFHINYWPLRSRAFDLFCLASHTKTKIQRATRAENDHFRKAGRLLQALENIFDSEAFEEKFKELSPEDAVNMLGKLVAIQRVSVGLPAAGPPKEVVQREAPTQVVMQQIINQPAKQEREEEKVDLLLDSPENLEMAQRLIISVNGASGAIDVPSQTDLDTGSSAVQEESAASYGNNEDLPI